MNRETMAALFIGGLVGGGIAQISEETGLTDTLVGNTPDMPAYEARPFDDHNRREGEFDHRSMGDPISGRLEEQHREPSERDILDREREDEERRSIPGRSNGPGYNSGPDKGIIAEYGDATICYKDGKAVEIGKRHGGDHTAPETETDSEPVSNEGDDKEITVAENHTVVEMGPVCDAEEHENEGIVSYSKEYTNTHQFEDPKPDNPVIDES